MPTTSEIASDPKVVCKLFTMAVPKPSPVNSWAKWAKVNDWGSRAMWPRISSVSRTAMASSQ